MYLALHSPFAIFVESFEPDMYTNEENILYITDLDGTLLNSKGIVSATSAHILHHLIEEEGLNFTIATARTPATAMQLLATTGLKLPAVVMAGAALWDESASEYSHTWHIPENVISELCGIYESHGMHPFIYRQSGSQLLAYHKPELSPKEQEFVSTRQGTRYKRFIFNENPYSTSMHPALIIFSTGPHAIMHDVYRDIMAGRIDCHPIFYRDIYDSESAYLEIYASCVSKATAIRAIVETCGFDKIVAFGDNVNDIEMMKLADYSIAPSNAVDDVKNIADEVLKSSNDDDCVARWIETNAKL